MKGENIKDRIMTFTIRVVNMVAAMPSDCVTEYLSNQVIASVGKAGAGYWAACRSGSKEDFIENLKAAEGKLHETIYWLELIRGCKFFPPERLTPLVEENNELLSIIVKSVFTANKNGSGGERKKILKKQEQE